MFKGGRWKRRSRHGGDPTKIAAVHQKGDSTAALDAGWGQKLDLNTSPERVRADSLSKQISLHDELVVVPAWCPSCHTHDSTVVCAADIVEDGVVAFVVSVMDQVSVRAVPPRHMDSVHAP